MGKRHFFMKGVVTKRNFFAVAKNFGMKTAFQFLFSPEQTFLGFCVKKHLV